MRFVVVFLILFIGAISASKAAQADENDCWLYAEGEIALSRASRSPASAAPWIAVRDFASIVAEYEDVKYHFGGFLQPSSFKNKVHLFTLLETAPNGVRNSLHYVRLGQEQMNGQQAFGCGGFASVVLHRMYFGKNWKKQYALKHAVKTRGGTEKIYLHQMAGSDMAKTMGLAESGVMVQRGGKASLQNGGKLSDLSEGLYFFAASAGKSGHVGFIRLSSKNGKLQLRQWHASTTAPTRNGLDTVYSTAISMDRKVDISTLRVQLADGTVYDAKSIKKLSGSIEVRREGPKYVVMVKNIPLQLRGGIATGPFMDWWMKSIYSSGTVKLYKIPE